MRFTFLLLLATPSYASAQECYGPKLARDAVRAIALISDRAMITDMVGGSDGHIWANYRNHGYSDHYLVRVDSRACRVLELRIIETNVPIKEGD
jgi:hypothetical protein